MLGVLGGCALARRRTERNAKIAIKPASSTRYGYATTGTWRELIAAVPGDARDFIRSDAPLSSAGVFLTEAASSWVEQIGPGRESDTGTA